MIVVGGIYDEFLERLIGAASDLQIGHPARSGVQIGPLIDEDAVRRVRRYVEDAGQSGDVVLARDDIPQEGYFVGPTIVGDVRPGTPIATDEIFGPVLAAFRAGSIEEAISTANSTDYALTAGIVSRSPAHVRLRRPRRSKPGTSTSTRTITGAVVGRHPFGGYRAVRGRFEGWRTRLPAPVPRAEGREREHDPTGLGPEPILRSVRPGQTGGAQAGRSSCPPNCLRIAERILSKSEAVEPTGAESANRAHSSTPASERAFVDGSDRGPTSFSRSPTPGPSTPPSSGDSYNGTAAVRSSNHDSTTLPRRHTSATAVVSMSNW